MSTLDVNESFCYRQCVSSFGARVTYNEIEYCDRFVEYAIVTNATDDAQADVDNYYEIFSIICAWALVVLAMLGLVGNILAAIVFTRRSMRSSINVLLTALSIIDALLLVAVVPINAGQVFNAYVFVDAKWLKIIVNISLRWLSPISYILQTSSCWLFVVISIERYLAVCHPLKVKCYCTVTRARLAVFIVIIAASCYNLIRFFEFILVHPMCGSRPNLRSNPLYVKWYTGYFYIITNFVLPVAAIACLNITVVLRIINAQRRRKDLSSSQEKEHRTAIMMMVVIITFTCCYLLSAVLSFVELFVSHFYREFEIAFALTDMSNVLVIFNSTINFVIYMIFSKKFRTIVVSLALLYCLKMEPMKRVLQTSSCVHKFINDKETTTVGYAKSLKTLTNNTHHYSKGNKSDSSLRSKNTIDDGFAFELHNDTGSRSPRGRKGRKKASAPTRAAGTHAILSQTHMKARRRASECQFLYNQPQVLHQCRSYLCSNVESAETVAFLTHSDSSKIRRQYKVNHIDVCVLKPVPENM